MSADFNKKYRDVTMMNTADTSNSTTRSSRRMKKRHKHRSSVSNDLTEEEAAQGSLTDRSLQSIRGESHIELKDKGSNALSTHCSSRRSSTLNDLCQWLYDNLCIAEKNGEIRLMLDLMRIVDRQNHSDRAAILSKRHKSLLDHPWIHHQIRAEEAENLKDKATKARETRIPIISDRGHDDLDLDVYYWSNEQLETMEFIIDANLRDINIMSVSSLISEVEQYTKWMPVVGYAIKDDLEDYDEGYYCHVQFNSPLPYIVKNRDLAMHLKCDSDFRNPTIPDELSKQIRPYLREPNDSFHIWTESIGDDPLLLNKKVEDDCTYLLPPKGAPEPYQKRKRCERIYLQHGVGNIQLVQHQDRPSLKITMIISVDVGLIRPPEWVVKFVGGTLFKGIIREIMTNAKDIQNSRMGINVDWTYAHEFTELIKKNPIYRFLRRAIPEHLQSHLM